MKVIDLGSGPPVVVIPGLQGRWEWMRPGIDVLAETCRVVTFSLCDEPCSEARFDERAGFACYVEQVREALDQLNLPRAVICGVSYGGAIAAAFAARHPSRASALVLVSALSPQWTPNSQQRTYLKAPRLLAPLFIVQALQRMRPELAAAVPLRLDRVKFAMRSWGSVLRYPPVTSRMGRRVRLFLQMDPPDLSRVRVPVLLVRGESQLDRAVPVAETQTYAELMPHARTVTLPHTGHIGIVTRPRAFAEIVTPFVREHAA